MAYKNVENKQIRKIKVSIDTIKRKVSILKNGGVLAKKQRKTRSDKFFNAEVEAEIVDFLEEKPFAKAPQIRSGLEYDVNDRTIQQTLKTMGYTYLPGKSAPLITENQREARVTFAETNLIRDWDDTVFVDESSFFTHAAPNMAYQKKGAERISTPTPKHPQKLHAFGGITTRGKTDLYVFQENLNGELYVEILERTLVPSMRRLYGRESWYLCQDNDPKHCSGVALKCYNKRRIKRIDQWPSASPDLNPIENIWAIMKQKVSNLMPTTLDDLEQSIRLAWDEVSLETIQNCIQSMPRRLQAVIDGGGLKTNY